MPTSGLRACTASATEISYNHSDDPNELYRAQVEFISAEEWSQELKTLAEDVIDGNGNLSPDCYNPDTDAGRAYSIIRAVFPTRAKERILRHASDPSAMVQEPGVHAVLGSVKRLRATSSSDLFTNLQQYIDSKEKDSEEKESKKKDSKGKDSKEKKKMEYWRRSIMVAFPIPRIFISFPPMLLLFLVTFLES